MLPTLLLLFSLLGGIQGQFTATVSGRVLRAGTGEPNRSRSVAPIEIRDEDIEGFVLVAAEGHEIRGRLRTIAFLALNSSNWIRIETLPSSTGSRIEAIASTSRQANW
jgi:hypothetical protein